MEVRNSSSFTSQNLRCPVPYRIETTDYLSQESVRTQNLNRVQYEYYIIFIYIGCCHF